jgi:hypothetical protein
MVSATHSVNAEMSVLSESDADKNIVTQIPSAWRSCAKDSDCKLVNYHCRSAIAASIATWPEAQARAYAVGGDARKMSCPTGPGRAGYFGYAAVCVDHQCAATNRTE